MTIRESGIAWVCDLRGSTKRLNDPRRVSELEAFLPRFYQVAQVATKCSGSKFIKWTGDGFLSWHPDRPGCDLSTLSQKVMVAAEVLSRLIDETGLGTSPKKKFQICHAMSIAPNAMLFKVPFSPKGSPPEILSPEVTLAFRLSSRQDLTYPYIVATKRVVDAYNFETRKCLTRVFTKWRPSQKELLTVFKGQGYGTTALFRTSDGRSRSNCAAPVQQANLALKIATTGSGPSRSERQVVAAIMSRMAAWRKWPRDVVNEVDRINHLQLKSLDSKLG